MPADCLFKSKWLYGWYNLHHLMLRPFPTILFLPCVLGLVICAGAQPVHRAQTGNVKQAFASSPLPADANDLKEFSRLFQKKFTFSGGTIEASMIHNHSLVSNDYFASNSLSQYSFHGSFGIEALGIPFKAEYSRSGSAPQFLDYTPRNWYHVSMDVEKYKAKWRSLAEKLGPESLTQSGAALKAVRKEFSDRLVHEFRSKAISESQIFFDSLSRQIDPLELEAKTPEELAALFFGQDPQKLLEANKKKLADLAAADLLPEKKDSLLSELQSTIDRLENKVAYLKKITGLLSSARLAGKLEEMKNLDAKAKDEFDRLLQNPEVLSEKLAEKFNVHGFSKVIMLLSQLKIGDQSLPQQFLPFLNRSISFELNVGDKFLGVAIGNLIPINTNLIPDHPPLPGATGDAHEKPLYWSVHFRKGKLSENHKGIRLTGISGRDETASQLQPADFMKRRSLLIDLYSRERLFADQWLKVEISKSMVAGGLPKQYLFSLNNASFKLSAEGRIEKLGIYHQAYFTKMNGAYSNPLQNYLASNGYEAGFSFRMRPAKARIGSYLKGTIRNFYLNDNRQSRWNTTDLRARVSYKLKKGQSLQLSGNVHDGYKNYFFGNSIRTVRQQSQGLTIDASLVNKRIFGLYNTSFLSAGLQQDVFPVTGNQTGKGYVSASYTFLINQSFLMGDDILQLNLLYTRVTQEISDLLYNSRIDADAGMLFKVNDRIMAGTFVVLGYLKGGYTNIGMKPSLTAQLFKKFTVDVNADIRKNIRVQNPIFDQFTVVNCNLKYTIN